MNHQPLVSVIMIFLNEETFIQEAIESVIAQTYDHWELLLVDDGSRDRSAKIAKAYVAQYPGKIIYLDHDGHQNRGMSATRNLGIDRAKGEYLAFLDGDDVYLPEKLAQQVEIMTSHPDAAMVYGHTQDWFSWTGNPADSQRDLIYDLKVQTDTSIKPPLLFNLCLKREAPSPCTCSALLRRDIFAKVGRFEESFRGLYEDQVFFSKVMLQFPVFVSSKWWDRYRRRLDSCNSTARKTGQNYALRLAYLNWLEQYFDERAITNFEAQESIQKELWPYRHPILSRIRVRLQNVLKVLQ
ncbi:MAG: glycosyltransferase family 2 protein [Acaryochloridaceae cyanobacterium RU_4_10]|nr:glycosyltransferase family 2 protein [Acaryochloridaceae cyanobacterium RU_4_10]